MRTLCKKALALCVVFALALTCFVGTLSVSAADPYDATLTVADVDVNFGDTTATAVLHIAVAAPGINEAIINIDSTIGTIDAEPTLDLETLVVDGGGDAYVDVVGDDFSKLFLSARRDPAVTELNGILTADIAVEFTLNEGVKPGTYPINIVTEGVKAADKNETVVNLVYATEENPAGNFIVTCKHNNLVEDAELWVAPTCTEDGSKTFVCDDCKEYSYTEVDPATGHAEELTYTSNEDGTHAVDCPNCEDVFEAEDCADEDANGACDKCGYVFVTEPEEPVYNETVKVMAKNALFQSDYSLMFAIPTATAEGWYLVVEQEQFNENTKIDPRVVTLTVEDQYNIQNVKGTQCYTVLLTGIGARDVASKVSITLYAEVDGVMSYGPTEEYNLVTYAEKQIDNGLVAGATTKKQNFAKAMAAFLNYAADAQKRFKYNEANKANAGLSDAEKALAPLATEPVNYRNDEYVVNDSATASIQAYAPQYKDKMTLALLAYAPENADAVVEISYTNYKGQETTDSLPVAGGIPTTYKGLQCMQIDFTSIAFADVRSNIEIRIVDGEGNVISNTSLYSFESYAAGRKTTSDDYDPSRALVNFGDYIKTYFLS